MTVHSAIITSAVLFCLLSVCLTLPHYHNDNLIDDECNLHVQQWRKDSKWLSDRDLHCIFTNANHSAPCLCNATKACIIPGELVESVRESTKILNLKYEYKGCDCLCDVDKKDRFNFGKWKCHPSIDRFIRSRVLTTRLCEDATTETEGDSNTYDIKDVSYVFEDITSTNDTRTNQKTSNGFSALKVSIAIAIFIGLIVVGIIISIVCRALDKHGSNPLDEHEMH